MNSWVFELEELTLFVDRRALIATVIGPSGTNIRALSVDGMRVILHGEGVIAPASDTSGPLRLAVGTWHREASLTEFKKKLGGILLNRFAGRCFSDVYACLERCGLQPELCEWVSRSGTDPYRKLVDVERNSTSSAMPSVKQAIKRSDSSLSCDEPHPRRQLSGRRDRRRSSSNSSLSVSDRRRGRERTKAPCKRLPREWESSSSEDELLVEPKASGIYRFFQGVSARDVDSNVREILRARRRRLEELDAQRDIVNKKVEVAILERAQSLEQPRPKKWIRDGCPQMKKTGSLR